MSDEHKVGYYLPAPSYWPIIGSIALFLMALGTVGWLHQNSMGPYVLGAGALILVYMLFGWFGAVIRENRTGMYDNPQVGRSFRLSFAWFLFTELMLFVGLFGALFYARIISVPMLGGADIGSGQITHFILWPSFQATWPLLKTPNPAIFGGAKAVMEAWGIPALNTLVMLCSAVTITWGYFGMLKGRRWQMLIGQSLTVLLGIAFLYLQYQEYFQAITIKHLLLNGGIYASTFYFLTGFDALHVFAGVIMLIVILWRMFRGDFTPKDHFAYSAIFWYWHFVEFIWLMLFIFVYWI